MGYYRKAWKPSKKAASEFREKMDEVEQFLAKTPISASQSRDSFYFTIGGKNYRVSNHSVEKSNDSRSEAGLDVYHPHGREENTQYIHASKTRIIEIYQAIAAGHAVDGHGYII